jgi:hypothetical protein
MQTVIPLVVAWLIYLAVLYSILINFSYIQLFVDDFCYIKDDFCPCKSSDVRFWSFVR